MSEPIFVLEKLNVLDIMEIPHKILAQMIECFSLNLTLL